jgi:hypothetical protein
MPVHLWKCSITEKEGEAWLCWESNAEGEYDFEVEYAPDGLHFENIGKGESFNEQYAFKLPQQAGYVRLRVERGQQVSYSAVLALPAHETYGIASLYNVKGEMLGHFEGNALQVQAWLANMRAQLTSGMYIVQVVKGKQQQVIKWLK